MMAGMPEPPKLGYASKPVRHQWRWRRSGRGGRRGKRCGGMRTWRRGAAAAGHWSASSGTTGPHAIDSRSAVNWGGRESAQQELQGPSGRWRGRRTTCLTTSPAPLAHVPLAVMGDVLQRMFTLASGVSLLFLGTAVLWVRSYMHLNPRRPTIRGDDGYFDADFTLEYSSADAKKAYVHWLVGFVHGAEHPHYGRGFGYQWDEFCVVAVVPHWFLAAVFGLTPSVWIGRRMRRPRRRIPGICSTCCYDLRASPEHCPECGAAVVRAAPVQRPGA